AQSRGRGANDRIRSLAPVLPEKLPRGPVAGHARVAGGRGPRRPPLPLRPRWTSTPLDEPALRRSVFGAFVLGLGLSITLSESALTLLTLLWLWRLRDPAGRAAARWPLWQPVLAFSAVTLVSALASGHPATALAASKGLLLVAVLYVTADALAGAEDGHRFLSALLVVVTVAAVVGLLQTAACPGPDPDYGWPSWLYHRCYRARGFFSIYMTLAGVLSLVLLACLPRLLPGAVAPRWTIAPWLVSLLGLLATYTRGAWVGFGTAVLSLLPITRKRRGTLLPD